MTAFADERVIVNIHSDERSRVINHSEVVSSTLNCGVHIATVSVILEGHHNGVSV